MCFVVVTVEAVVTVAGLGPYHLDCQVSNLFNSSFIILLLV